MHAHPSWICETCSALVAHIDVHSSNFSSYCYSHSRLCSGADNLQVHSESYSSPCCHETLRFRTNLFWNQNVFLKFSVTCCEGVLTCKAEGACLPLCQPLLYSLSFPSHSIFAQPGCYLCCSCMAVLLGSAAWEWVSSSLWVSLEILSPLQYQSLMQNKDLVLNPTCLDGHDPWELVPLSHPLLSWVDQLIDPLLLHTWPNRNRKGKFRPALSSCPQQLMYPGEKGKLLLTTQVAILSFRFLSAVSFPTAPSWLCKKEDSFCKWHFSQEEMFPVGLITVYPGSSFLSHSQTDSCCCSV